MQKRPLLLLTNDDGIQAPGLKHLWQTLSDFADIVLVAPHKEKSGAGLSITWTKPLQIRPVTWENNTRAYSVNGTPADCVKMALTMILESKPDLIVSGVNSGSNSGKTVLYSGTIGAVTEGVFKNIPGIAFSFSDLEPPPIEMTQHYILSLVKRFCEEKLPPGTLLNVNFPFHFKEKGTKGLRFAKQGKGFWKENPEKRIHPEGIPYYWLGGTWQAFEEDPESDIALLEQGYIAAVPIQVAEMTDLSTYERFKNFSVDKLPIEESLDPS